MIFNKLKFYQGLQSDYEKLNGNFTDYCFYYTYSSETRDENGSIVSIEGPYKLWLNDKLIYSTTMAADIVNTIINEKLLDSKFNQYLLKNSENQQLIKSPLKIEGNLIIDDLEAGIVKLQDLIIANEEAKVSTLNIKSSAIDYLTIREGSINNCKIDNNSSAKLIDLEVTEKVKLPIYKPEGTDWSYNFESGILDVNTINAKTIKVEGADVATNAQLANAKYDYIQIGDLYLSSLNGQLQITSIKPQTGEFTPVN